MKLKNVSFSTQIIISVILGIIVGLLFPTIAMYLEIIGDIFLRVMQMSIPALVLGQIIKAIGEIDVVDLPKLGFRTVSVFLLSSLLASFFGILMASIFNPGSGIDIPTESANIEALDLSISETLVSFFPQNIFESLANGSIIQIIIFALFFGLALNRFMAHNPESSLMKLIIDLNDVIMRVIGYVMMAAPLGIFSLISGTISRLGISIIIPLVKYLGVYALATVLFILLWLLVIMLYVRINPIKLMVRMKDMSLMALATTSSAVTLPLAMKDTRELLGVSNRVVNFVLPLGMSLNSNGAAMHMAITVITISQLYGIEFNVNNIIFLGVLATFVSLANAVVPGAGLVSLAIIVPQMGLPVESIAIFAGVEWFVGMIRTILNVNSDVFSAIVVAHSLDELDKSYY